MVAPNAGLETLLFAKEVVEQAEIAAGDPDATGNVDGSIEGKLDSFDEVEGDGILEAAECDQ